ncbi:MAG TPA: serine hydrolase domain-containing protein [Streptosporangiaceae bacterium]|jgi:CubicO group peptidase (beta-lactamase class C family)
MSVAPGEELLPETRRALLRRVATGQADGRAPSVTAGVVRDGRLTWCGSRSIPGGREPDADTQYRIGSISKTLVAIMVMRLRDEGVVDLADPLRKHLSPPAHRPPAGSPAAVSATTGGQATGGLDPADAAAVLDVGQVGDLTVGQLLSHTGGLAAEASAPWWERTPGELRPGLADIFAERPHKHPAGRTFHYSNPGYALLGGLITQLRGEEWGEAVRREVLEPLGMSRTTLDPEEPYQRGWAVHPWADVLQPEPFPHTRRMAPAGQYWSTTRDMGRLAAFLLDGDSRVLADGTLAEMRTPASAPEDEKWTGGYGLGIQLFRADGRTLHGHSGSMPGFVSSVVASPQDRLAAVAFANVTAGANPNAIAGDLIKIVAEREPSLPAPWQPLPEVDQALLELTGLWYWGPRPFTLRLLPDRMLDLSPAGSRGRLSRYRPEADGTWTALDNYYAGETLRLVRRADGTVDHLDVGTFVFTREPYPPGAPAAAQPDPDGWAGGLTHHP